MAHRPSIMKDGPTARRRRTTISVLRLRDLEHAKAALIVASLRRARSADIVTQSGASPAGSRPRRITEAKSVQHQKQVTQCARSAATRAYVHLVNLILLGVAASPESRSRVLVRYRLDARCLPPHNRTSRFRCTAHAPTCPSLLH